MGEQLKTPKKRKKKIPNKSKKKSVAPIDLTMQITPKQSLSSTPNRNGLRLPSLETTQLQMNEDEMNGYDQSLLACNEKHPSTTNSAQSSSSNNDNNDVIDLTQTEVASAAHSSNNSLDSQSSKQSRKRKRTEIDEMTQQCSPIISAQTSPPIKKRKLNGNHNGNSSLSLPSLNYSNSNAVSLCDGSLVAIKTNDGGLRIVVVDTVLPDQNGLKYKDYFSGIVAPNIIDLKLCHHMVPYFETSSELLSISRKHIGDTFGVETNLVYALIVNEEEKRFNINYKIAQVLNEPQHKNDLIKIKYQHNNESEIALYTMIKSPHNIPTVIRILPAIGANETKDPRNDNVQYTRSEPPKSSSFHCNLPQDPWNDRYFQGIST